MNSRKNSQNCSVVIPTIRQGSITPFLNAWEKEFKGKHVIVVEDNPHKSFNLPSWVEHYSWEEIDKELGKNSWIISRRTSAIRSFGFLKAWKKKTKYIITLDDDCLPESQYGEKGFVKMMIDNLEKKWNDDSWFNTIGKTPVFPRGYPYRIREKKQKTMIHHGLWSNIPDLDGKTQKKMPAFRTHPFSHIEKVPFGKFYPMCSMNLVFRKEITPALYFLLMGQKTGGRKWPYDRFDDIWAGIFAKKICDHFSFAISSGAPSVQHSRASNVDINIQKEKTGIIANELLWKEVANISLTGNSINQCYQKIAKELGKKGNYWKTLSKAMIIWSSYFD